MRRLRMGFVFVCAAVCGSALAADDMITIPAGAFTMGRNDGPEDERPAHQITLPTFQIDRLPVTNVQFAEFLHKTLLINQTSKTAKVAGYRLPDILQLLLFGLVNSAVNPKIIAAHLEVHSTFAHPFAATRRDDGRHMRLIRRFIGTETGVPVNAENGILWRQHNPVVHLLRTLNQRPHELTERFFHAFLKAGLIGIEPITVVVEGKLSEEIQEIGGEVSHKV